MSLDNRFYAVALEGDVDAARELLSTTSVSELNWKGEDRCTALIMSSKAGHVGIVELLLSREDLEVNCWDKDGRTALVWASDRGHLDIVELVLAHCDVQVNLQEKYGRTALMMSASLGHINVFQRLLHHPNIDVNIPAKNGNSVLVWAAYHGKADIVRLLLRHPNVQANLQNKIGCTALMQASRMRHYEVVKLLLTHPGIDLSLLDKNGRSVFDAAKSSDVHALLQMHEVCQAPTSWLATRLLSSGLNEQVVKDCEQKLILKEGFVSEFHFAVLLPEKVDAEYLEQMGILDRRVQNKIINLHRQIHAQLPSLLCAPLPPPPTEKGYVDEPSFTCAGMPIQNVQT
eukprot:CAMPEP_0184978170 /NCGR_PEP_ID=MMETSP1098-20130426/8768_1 /TAXON_ID=89044 /ORGANISM="Spumella elongata, Strain CCAP 955/1" /LENGTH=343 /DNA_ID=CAMNT_0027501283 /DNA_START=101 /DNA_END=1128 /DNA_ORIENTATION=+